MIRQILTVAAKELRESLRDRRTFLTSLVTGPLLLAFFFRHLPQLIRGEKLYLALPPLYRIAVGQESHYARDDAHREEILATLPKNRNFEISRFKGLGEMTASQLKVTTLDPKTRILLRVDIESQLDADKTFTELLGKDASERYRIIMDEASQVDDLDI